jgi:hypothetical protein
VPVAAPALCPVAPAEPVVYPALSACPRCHCRDSAVAVDWGDREAGLQAAVAVEAADAGAAVDSDAQPAALADAAVVEADAAAADGASSSRVGHTRDDRRNTAPNNRRD